MMDVDALIHLLTHDSYSDNKPIVELIQNAKTPLCKVEATYAKFEYKNLLRKETISGLMQKTEKEMIIFGIKSLNILKLKLKDNG